ncbi:hypothetical protein M2137_002028 [Parabacteroides sp. PFB2-10]|uniref:3-keto-disaccharide hydrolase n=1 Tax=Parabacteroides sp. PFB2-10 TaxID=1742405 RepID=UPI002476080B|nr:DUF1080 domain-containing protein [Parabacteroides sp. PFB2-10]MDH6313238.1 hypothetical protein [Parabacteroides sp. PFB2-10]
MKKYCLAKKTACVVVFFLLCIGANAQEKEYPKPEPMRPGMSEFWTPQPAVVTPGDPITQSAPSDAIVLFDGTNLDAWKSARGDGEAKWTVQDGAFTVAPRTGDIETRQHFNSFQLHIEWASPTVVKGESQGRGNSGVFMQGLYEVQILDCYDNETYINGQTGSIYKQSPPLVNAMRKPGEWNVYDIIYNAPIFKEDGTYRVPPTITVIQNGIVLQNHTTILGTTEYIGFPQVKPHGAGPIVLQDHGNLVRFRNIWIREL